MKNIIFHDYCSLFASTSGSHVYGFPSIDSDHDIRAVHILPIREVISLNKKHQDETITELANNSDGVTVDFVSHDIYKFCHLILKKDGNSLEQLFSPLLLESQEELPELREIVKTDCITKYYAHHYIGFAVSQWTAFVASNYKLKNLLYVYRILLTGLHLMNTGEIKMHLPTLAEEYSLNFVYRLIEQKSQSENIRLLLEERLSNHETSYLSLLEKLEKAAETTHLQKYNSPDRLNDFLIRVRLKYGN